MATVAQIFQQLGLIQWWDSSRVTQRYGQNGEKGTDFGLGGFGRPVGSITSGTVVYVGDGGYGGSSIGQIVQVLTPDGHLLHYQHLKTSEVTKGQKVGVGTVLGTGGGCPVGAYPSDPSAQGCTRYDSFSTGQHIEVRYSPTYNAGAGVWGQNWAGNNLAIFQQIAGGAAGSIGLPFSGNGSNGQSGTPASPVNLNWGSIGTKIGVFVFGLVLLLIGLYMTFQPQIDGMVKKGTKTAEKVVLT